ncbi:MAG: hypothetical protein ABI813_00800 [Bacteroidota bacterium]
MKRKIKTHANQNNEVMKGYNEANPGQSQGAFRPASEEEKPLKNEIKSNAASKKAKEDQN